ncbi:hypothetical protein I5M32_15900 [Pedobacter sp. SD-b]|uniref:DUF1579 domain-containing protein n=2 Tax=Pedobacter segetis TaxID=2793069 RepID=A0ABS1BNH7_9SPHI|nr:hypothetical protein [Pedobacter segetis]MBK0384449.1 hypothetical protein [Pedobacter segetis]
MMLLISISSYAQRTISFAEAAAYKNNPEGIPEDVSYVKDVDNKLPKFVGTWKGVAAGKSIELHLKQILHLPEDEYGFKLDQLVGRTLIKDASTGDTLYNTLNIIDDNNTGFQGSYYFYNENYSMYFFNLNDDFCMDWGDVSITVSPTDPTKLKLYFVRRTGVMMEVSKCPNISTYVPILPKSVELTKQ